MTIVTRSLVSVETPLYDFKLLVNIFTKVVNRSDDSLATGSGFSFKFSVAFIII